MSQTLSDPIAVRLPVDVLAQVNAIAAVSERSRSWVILRALRLYLASEGADIMAVAEGRQAIANEGGIDMNDVIAEVEKIVAGGSSRAA